MNKTVTQAIKDRRSVRKYKEDKIDAEKVKKCIENATLAPNSSNMQLWEFIHITDKNILKKIAHACFNQNAAKTSKIWLYLLPEEINGDLELRRT